MSRLVLVACAALLIAGTASLAEVSCAGRASRPSADPAHDERRNPPSSATSGRTGCGNPRDKAVTGPLPILGPNLVLVVKGQHKAVQDERADTMTRFSYLIWFRRLVVLGAVVAGLAASGAGAAQEIPNYGPYPISGGTGFFQVATYPESDQSTGTSVSGCARPLSTCALVG